MFARIIRPVREQPDTGYRKSLLPYFAAAPGLRRDMKAWGLLDFFKWIGYGVSLNFIFYSIPCIRLIQF